MAQYTELQHLGVIRIEGDDGQTFLQGQLTLDLRTLAEGMAPLAGWTDASGRLVALPRVWRDGMGFGLVLPAAIAPAVCQRLRLYILRARVTARIEAAVIHGLWARAGEFATGEGGGRYLELTGDDGRSLYIGPVPAAGPPHADGGERFPATAWLHRDIRAGLPEIVAGTQNAFVPQMVNLDLLGGISFDKGCYVGQEIVARTHYRGRIKRRLLRFTAAGRVPPPGTAVHAARGVTGQVVSAVAVDGGCELLAVVYLDDLPGPLRLGDADGPLLERLPLPYAIPELDRAGD